MKFPESPEEGFNPEAGLSIEEKVTLCQERIGYCFANPTLVASALTHASVATSRTHSNERMEFLGDAILGMVVCEHVFQTYPEYLEGDLTKIKSIVVSRRVCAKVSKALGLEDCLVVGRGMMRHGMPRSLLSDVFEAVVAAVFLDGGLDQARSFILRHLETEIRLAAEGHSGGNYKSMLQQLAQGNLKGTPVYRLVGESGPDHSKYFEVAAEISGKRFTSAWGRNKKEAEQRAAGNALAELRGEEAPFATNSFVNPQNRQSEAD
ncbi:MAG: Ribonuclease 3 [Planctomycetota bacterium]|jgi:ribonuclease-3